jgi:hypothetical protein
MSLANAIDVTAIRYQTVAEPKETMITRHAFP